MSAPKLSRLLKVAVVAGVEPAVRIHIERGDDLNARDDNGLTPLMLAALRNNAAICRLLLDAGAETRLLDPSGSDALSLAKAAGAFESASMIERVSAAKTSESVRRDEEPTAIPDLMVRSIADSMKSDQSSFEDSNRTCEETQGPATQRSSLHDESLASNSVAFPNLEVEMPPPGQAGEWPEEVADAESVFDLSAWEPEDERRPPEHDRVLAKAALLVQNEISHHVAIDSAAADWEEFDAFLPEYATPIPRAEDLESRDGIRRLFLRGIREGSVPESSIDYLCRRDDGSDAEDLQAVLRAVLLELGSETDERHEDSSEIFIEPEETTEEVELVDLALERVDDLAANRSDPLHIYLREIQRGRLIPADVEIEVAKSMEDSLNQAFAALAVWSGGLAIVIAAAELVENGAMALDWLSTSTRDEPSFNNEDGLDERDAGTVESMDDESYADDEHQSPTKPAGFFEKAKLLSGVCAWSTESGDRVLLARNILSSLQLNRRFLTELADTAVDDASAPAERFAHAMRAYTQAFERMVLANLRLVVSMAKRYIGSGTALEDLIQEGNIGLLKAVERFDWRRGFRFATMAIWWIRQQISRAVANSSRVIRLPVHMHDFARRMTRQAEAFEISTDRQPTVFELSEQLAVPPKRIELVLRAVVEPTSLADLDEDDNFEEGGSEVDAFEAIAVSQLRATLDRMLSELGERAQKVLRLRFGLATDEALTLEEVGLRFDVTRERIRQIEAKALQRMRHPTRIVQLQQWWYKPIDERSALEGDGCDDPN